MIRTPLADRLDTLMLAAAACAALAACGGSEAPPPPATTTPTITAQPAATVTVAEGATATLAVTAESNAGALSYQWRSGSTTPSPIEGATAASYITPAASLLDQGRVFSVAVSNSVGTTTSGPSTLSVTERAWAAPSVPRSSQVGDDAPTDTCSLAVAIDSQGGSWMAFGEVRPNGARALRFSYTPAGQGTPQSTHWLGDADLPPFVSAHDVKLVAGNDGHVLAVWREGLQEGVGGTIRAALLLPGANGWSTFGALSGGGDAASPAAAYIGNGTFEIVWRQETSVSSETYDIVARRLVFDSARPNGELQGLESVESEAASALAPQIASDGAGNVLVAFSTSADYDRTYGNVRPAAAGAWTAANASQFTGLYPVALSSLAMNAQGRAVVLMRGVATNVYMSQYQFGGNEPGWTGGAQYVANYNPNGAVEPVAVFGAGNDFSIVSVHAYGRNVSLWPCNANGCGAMESILSTSLDNAFTQLRAGRDAAGNLVVLFGQDQGNSLGVMAGALRWHAGLNAWRAPAYAGTLGSYHVNGAMQLAVRPDGSALALYPAAIGEQTFARSWAFR
jgi:hypothetical protein